MICGQKSKFGNGIRSNPGFANADSEEEQALLQEYVTDFVGRYREDDRILLWDLYNEPEVSFFTVCRGVLHGEATLGAGAPATFYVTESARIRRDYFSWEGNKIQITEN